MRRLASPRRASGGLVFLVVAVVVAAAAACVALLWGRRAAGPTMPNLLAAPPNTCTRTYFGAEPTPASLLPLRNDNGVFVVPLLVGGQRIRAVVDTGSENLLVADRACRGCDRTQGRYDGRTSGRPVAGRSPTTLRFGTQRDRAVFHVDDLVLVGANGDLCDTDRDAFGPVLRIPDVLFARVTRRTGESNYNILGLCNVDDDSFINQVTSPPHQQFTIYMHPTTGWLGFGDAAAIRRCVGAPPPAYLPLADPPPGMPFAFYVARIEGVRVGGRRLAEAPGYLLFDTGSNFSGCGPRFLDTLRREGVRPGGPPVEVRMRTTDGRLLTLTIRDTTYCWPDGTLLIEAHEPFHTRELNEGVFVLGSLFIQNYVLEFDVTHRRLGVSVVAG